MREEGKKREKEESGKERMGENKKETLFFCMNALSVQGTLVATTEQLKVTETISTSELLISKPFSYLRHGVRNENAFNQLILNLNIGYVFLATDSML